jgi:ferredoxin
MGAEKEAIMPSLDGTGPRGRGAITGGRRGCGGVRLRRRAGSRRGAAGDGAVRATEDALARIPLPMRAVAPSASPIVCAGGAPARVNGVRRAMVAKLSGADVCIGCGDCLDACARSAIGLDVVAVVDEAVCTGCGMCVVACPSGALKLVAA